MSKRTLAVTLVIFLAAAILGEVFYRHQRKSREPKPFELSRIAIASGAPAETLPVRTNCLDSTDETLRFESEVRVPLSIAMHLNLEKNPLPAIEAQLRYLNGYFNFDEETRTSETGYSRIVIRPEPEIEVLGIERVTYGRTLEVDPVSGDKASLYPTSWAKKTVRISAKEPALKIRYRAGSHLTLCRRTKTTPPTIAIRLPRDPYLAYWYVPASARREIRYHKTTTSINPCADPQMAEMKRPFMYWYTYDPHAKGRDSKNQPYDCRELSARDPDTLTIEGRLEAKAAAPRELAFDQLAKSEMLDVRMVFGFMGYTPVEDLRVAKEALLNEKDLENLPERVLNPSGFQSHPDWDPAIWGTLDSIRSLREIADVTNLVARDAGDSVIVEARARMHRSKKAIKLSYFIGSTDEHQKVAKHYPFLADAFKASDMIFYVGHAGLGENMSLARMRENLKLNDEAWSALFREKPYQLLGIVSCYGNGYFGADYVAERNRFAETDLMTTAAGRYLHYVPTGVLFYLDLKLAGEAVSLERALAIATSPHDVVLYDRFARLD
ncbi:MAG: hypothetical protein V4760_14400 [Bdellovibrionota bacterium]